jgi:hypothetical protein
MDNIPEEELHFYYNREKRLENAPKQIQDFYEGKGPKGPTGLFEALVHTPASRFLLLGVVLSFVFVLLAVFLSSMSNTSSIAEIPVELYAFSFEDTVYVSLAMAESEGKTGLVEVAFSALDSEKNVLQVYTTQENYQGNQLFIRTTFPDYDIVYVDVKVTMLQETTVLNTSVQKK